MMIVAMIMRPWIMLMRNYINVVCYILADDVLITAAGEQMYNSFVSALNETHDYLQQMGARIAPDKSFNFASHPKAREWLERTLWPMIGQGIEVVNDFRYLGSHLSARASLKSSTLTKRLRQALQQLRRLRTCPATLTAKARAIITKIYAGALYGIEASSITTAELNTMIAAVINVFRTHNDSHHADWFFTANSTTTQDLDPYTQVFVRRVLQTRRTLAKAEDSIHLFKHNLARYAQRAADSPAWHHTGDDPPLQHTYLAPGKRRNDNTSHDKHDTAVDPQGPIDC